ncbi:hypothetical protein Cfor_01211 [Coptotermes formosanus]|uniref:Reverse transcriptase domain-containing protein n=1 Tax=Coptotermes formosanus TaxID=36987 RepID=A0A6L2Q4V2_COPFO|nr:hypothetical protein Cfor_01211 [Coptotermes formosanus]
MEDDEREGLIIRVSSDNEEFTDNEDSFDGTSGSVQHENKTNPFYEKLQFICVGLLLCFSSTTLIILLPLYLEVVDVYGDAYIAMIFTCSVTTLGLFVVSCVCGRFGNGVKTSLMPPFGFSSALYTGLIYGISGLLAKYSQSRADRHRVDVVTKTDEYNLMTYHLFIDFKSAYGTVDREQLYEGLKQLKIPDKLIRLVKMTMMDTRNRVKILDDLSDEIRTEWGLRQGDALSCLLFNIALEKVMVAYREAALCIISLCSC